MRGEGGEGRRSELTPPFLGETETTLVFLELYLDLWGSCSCKTQKWPLKSGVPSGDRCLPGRSSLSRSSGPYSRPTRCRKGLALPTGSGSNPSYV